jgi:uncharacterized protein YcnI
MTNMKHKLLGAAGLASVLMVASAAPAFAHVTTNPDSAPKGGEITLGFRVPNEQDKANTVTVEIDLPTDHPLLGVLAEPVTGWTSTSTSVTLNPPIQTDDGPVSSAVNKVTWTAAAGGGTAPGQFQEFHVLVQGLPKDTDQSVFKAIQTYSDGTVVRWIDPVIAGQPAPAHPTPILTLTAAADTGGSTSSTTVAGTKTTTAGSVAPQVALDTSKLAKKSSVDTAQTVGIIGIVVGALGLIAAVAALATRRRTTASSTPSS